MTVPTEGSRSHYAGNGVTTAFSTGFYFLAASDLRVTIIPVGLAPIIQTLGVHYTVTVPAPGSGAAGTVTMLTPPASGADVFIERTVPFVQDTSFRTQGSFSPAVHEDAMDRLEFQLQQLDRRTTDLESGFDPGAFFAGNGLSMAGVTLNVGAGDGILSLADSVAVDFATGVVPVRADGGAVGTGTKAARDDHRHDVQTGNPAALHVGDTTSAGAATSLALSDHQHAVPTGVPASISANASNEGVSTAFPRLDHTHEVMTAAGALECTDATGVGGVSEKLSRGDHQHPHGDRGGGTLHALATTTTHGFMHYADKEMLARRTEFKGTTTNATPQTLAVWTPTNGDSETALVTVTARDKATANAASYGKTVLVSRLAGTTSIRGVVRDRWADIEDVAGWDCVISTASPQVIVTVTGAAGTNIDWVILVERHKTP
jgi:hypothetical protein